VIPCSDNIARPTSTFQSLRLNFFLTKRISKIIKSEGVDIAIGFITSANILTTIASKLNHIPCIISERNNPLMEDVPRFWVLLRNIFYPLADKIVLQTAGVKKIYDKKIKSNKIIILPNPISRELSIRNDNNAKKKKIILTVGRLVKDKCQDILIKAFNEIDTNDWKVKIIGNGDKKSELQSLIENYNLSHKIEIISNVKHIDKYYNEASIFVFTSRFEGFPNALLEAMHFGIPSISTDCNFGPSDLITDGINGFLIPINDIAILKNKLTKLMNNENLRNKIAKDSKKTTVDFQSKNVVKQWEKLILNCI
jgi:GalNAc-alpha-(1->4)-GalNAc-alpha-(1->3)-diNAcBac-PP-undecaprenol alpha-1,4-N-acetyl-D-galactosaminyltransferase